MLGCQAILDAPRWLSDTVGNVTAAPGFPADCFGVLRRPGVPCDRGQGECRTEYQRIGREGVNRIDSWAWADKFHLGIAVEACACLFPGREVSCVNRGKFY